MVSKMWDKDFWVKYSSNEPLYKNSRWDYITHAWNIISEQEYVNNLTKYIGIRWSWINKDTWKEVDVDWYDKFWYDKNGFDRDWFDYKWYDKDGYDRNWYDKFDFDRMWINRDTKTKVDNDWHTRDYYN